MADSNAQKIPKLIWWIFLLILTGTGAAGAQKTIQLKNPSFEDKPRMGDVPAGWKNCGFKGETPPDIQPCGAFDVTALPAHGDTYLGMVTRDNDTWEKVGTRLSSSTEAGMVYEFKIRLSRSEQYRSASRLTLQPANFTTPVVLRIFAGNRFCEKEQLLGVSPPIDHTGWATYRFTLSTKGEYSHLLLEAYYADRLGDAYCGNLLVDQASDLVPLGPAATIDKAALLGEKVETDH